MGKHAIYRRRQRRREKGRRRGPNRPSQHMSPRGRTGKVWHKMTKKKPAGNGERHCWPVSMAQAALMY